MKGNSPSPYCNPESQPDAEVKVHRGEIEPSFTSSYLRQPSSSSAWSLRRGSGSSCGNVFTAQHSDTLHLSTRIPEEDLRRLEGGRLDGFTVHVKSIHRPRGRERECRYLELYARDSVGRSSLNSVVDGLYSSGRASLSLKSYFDIDFNYKLRFKDPFGGFDIDISDSGQDLLLFKLLSELVDPGGKIIVAVTSPLNLELIDSTFTALDYGVPPEATYIGSLLHRCGCGSSFKTWLIREGGREGPPALQGEKAADQERFKTGLRESAAKLIDFLKSPPKVGILPLERAARSRAVSILEGMKVDDRRLQEMIDATVSARPFGLPPP